MAECPLCRDLLPGLDEDTFFSRYMNINTGSDVVNFHFSASELCASAKRGCVICSMILDGVSQFSTRLPWFVFKEQCSRKLCLNFTPIESGYTPKFWIDVYGLEELGKWAMVEFSSPKGTSY
jgi:hypothetical protein